MAELKYAQYRLNQLPPEQRRRGFGRWPQTILFTDNDIIEGSKHFWSYWVKSLPPPHGPHTHKDMELLVMLGSDPAHPKDLGCEIEFSMGPEMEKHVIRESTLVYVPANLVHGPVRFRNFRKPFIFIQAQSAPKLTEKPLKELVPRQERDTMVFFDFDGTQTDGEVERQYRKLQNVEKAFLKSQGGAAEPAEAARTGETKYSPYFLNEVSAEKRKLKFGRLPQTVIFTDDEIIKGSHQFWVLWISSLPWPEHGPHNHQVSESMVILGTNMDNLQDAGLETEDYMGIDGEKYITTESNLIFMPAGFVHGPIRYRNLRKPFIMVQCHYAPKLTEKSFKKLAAEKERDKLVFFDLEGTETDADLQRQRGKRAGNEDLKK